MPAHAHTKLTYEEYLLIPNDGKRHELIDGEHFMTPSPNTKHQRVVGRLFNAITNYLDERLIGDVFVAPYDIVLSPYDVCEPDIVFVAKTQSAIITPANIQGAPALIVEVLSEGTRKLDETFKRDRYEQAGVKEYWIVDPEAELVKVLRLTEKGYGQPTELRLERRDELTTPLLPSFRLPLTRLFK
jgi:Uma2 family endonuclease